MLEAAVATPCGGEPVAQWERCDLRGHFGTPRRGTRRRRGDTRLALHHQRATAGRHRPLTHRVAALAIVETRARERGFARAAVGVVRASEAAVAIVGERGGIRGKLVSDRGRPGGDAVDLGRTAVGRPRNRSQWGRGGGRRGCRSHWRRLHRYRARRLHRYRARRLHRRRLHRLQRSGPGAVDTFGRRARGAPGQCPACRQGGQDARSQQIHASGYPMAAGTSSTRPCHSGLR